MNRAKPEDWWRTTRIGDDVTLIDEPHIKPFYRCNCWHVRGPDGDALIDAWLLLGVIRRSSCPSACCSLRTSSWRTSSLCCLASATPTAASPSRT